MQRMDGRDREIAELRERLALLSQASLRINESLDFDTVLQEVVDSARALTASRYGAITVLGEAGQTPDFIVSGLSREEHQGLWDMPQGRAFFEYLSGLGQPLRVSNVEGHLSALNMPTFLPSVPVKSLLVAPIRHQGVGVGTIFLGHDREDREFTLEDEETLVMFASQAAMAIANARRHREERRARADLETLIDTSPVGVVVFDAATGVPKSLNREALRIVDRLRNPGQTPEDLLDEVTFKRADGREASLREFPMAEMLSVGETVRAEEIVLRVPDGRSVTVLLNATPILSEGGAVESVVVTMQDMAEVEELERLRADFLAMVSHELRAPLTSIKGSAATVLGSVEDLDPALVRQFFRIIEEQADHMHGLVADLLDVARIETGMLPVSPEPAEVAVLVDRARSAFTSAGGRNPLEIDVAPDLPLVTADRRRVVQVLVNLLSNAARHSPPSSVIRVSAVAEEVQVAFSVADQGRGIPAETLPLLFRKFSPGRSQEQGEDTGLGLAICKGIVEAHGGTHPGRERRAGPGGALHLHPAHGGGGWERPGGVCSLSPTRPAGRTGGTGAGAGGGRRPPGPALRPGHPGPGGLPAGDDRRPGGGPAPDARGAAPPGAAGPDAARNRRHRADAGPPGHIPRAGNLHFGLRPGGPSSQGLRRGRGGLPGQALFAHGAGGEDPGGTAPAGGVRTPGTLRAWRPGCRLRPAPGDPGGSSRCPLVAMEYRMLAELAANAGQVLTYEHLLDRVWGEKGAADVRPMRTIVSKLRRKLGDDADNPTYVFTEPRVGYWMPRGEAEGGELAT